MTPFISSPVTNKKPAGASILRRACLETRIPLPGLVTTGTAAKVEMKTRQADVRTTAAAVAGAMTRVVTAAIPITWPVRLVTTVAGVVAAAMARSVGLVAAMTGVVVTGAASVMAGAVTRTMPAPMTGTAGGMMISRLHSGRSENGKAGSDNQESDELFHIELGLIHCRQMSGLSQQTRPRWNYSAATHFFLLPRCPSQLLPFATSWRSFPRNAGKSSTEQTHGLAN
jgi:hypothetical protein